MSTEAPFTPREKLFEKQKFFQSVQKHTYLKGRMDIVTSVAIPAALAATSLFMIVSTCWLSLLQLILIVALVRQPFTNIITFCQGRGIYNMSHGIGKKEWYR